MAKVMLENGQEVAYETGRAAMFGIIRTTQRD